MTGSFVYRIFSTAVIAGGVAGLILATVQHLTVTPMILEAETYETVTTESGHGQQSAGSGEGHHTHTHHTGEAWSPEDGFERSFFTFVNTMIIGIGFALILVAGYAIRTMVSESGTSQFLVNWKWGILWGLGGFAAFHLAPAVGLPPELPGAGGGESALSARQMWWWFAVVSTGGGLLALAFAPGFARWLGLALIALPHLFGAPETAHHAGLAPPELASAFVVASLVTNAVFWVVLGVLTVFLYSRRLADQKREVT